MKRTIKGSSADEELDFYCTTVRELISALQKFPKDAQLVTTTGYRSVARCRVQVSSGKVWDSSGSFYTKCVSVDAVEPW